MASLIDTLIDVLGQEDAEYKKLLELSNNKTKAIVGADIVGAIACVWIYRLWGGVPAMVIGTVVVILIRYLAAHYRWNLPRLRRE